MDSVVFILGFEISNHWFAVAYFDACVCFIILVRSGICFIALLSIF